MKHLSLDPVVIPDALDRRVKWLSRLQIDTNGVAFRLLILIDTSTNIVLKSLFITYL